jgi:hypothetical protein
MPGDRVITIQEAGRPPQKCKLLKMWREKDGSMAYLVQALDTAEMLSIVESRTQATTTPTSSPVRAVATRIFHWGVGNKVPPAGTPMPPEDAVAVSPAPANQGPSPATPPPPAAATQPSPSTVTTRPAPVSPPVVSNVPATAGPVTPSTPSPEGKLTPTPAGTVPNVVIHPVEERHGLFGLRKGECSSCGSSECGGPCSPTGPGVVVEDAPRPRLMSRLLHRPEPTETVVMQTPPPPPAQPVIVPMPVPSAEVTKAPPSNYRESWGQVEPWRPSVDGQDAAKNGDRYGYASHPQVDPMKGPERYHQMVIDELARKAAPGIDMEGAGLGSVAAAGMGPPPGLGRLGFPGPFGPPPQPPDPFRTQRAPPVYTTGPGLRQDQGIPAAMANAFTPGDGTARPIPADFGSVHYPENAFSAPSADPYYASAMAAQGAPTSMPNAFLFPGVPAPMHGGMPGTAAAYAMPSPVMHVPSYPAMLPPAQAHVAAAPAKDATTALPEGATTAELMKYLKGSLYPSQREYAAESLSSRDWHKEPQVVEALVVAAKADPAPTVRAGCLRALAAMKANTAGVITAVAALKNDADPRVRQAAAEAMPALCGE